MKRNIKYGIILIAIILFALYMFWPTINPFIPDNPNVLNVVLSNNDRILIMAPHPDDESVATGGLIQNALDKGIPVHVVFLTYGDFNVWSYTVYEKIPMLTPSQALELGEIRHQEALNAIKELGLSEKDVTFLGYPDYGTSEILYYHWGNNAPYSGILTRKTEVPYSTALSPGAPYKGESIMKDIESVINDFNPTKIFVSHPDDYHPDHRAMFVFTTVSLWDMGREVEIYPYLVHYRNWPLPLGYYPSYFLDPPSYDDGIVWKELPMSSRDAQTKFSGIKSHVTQYESNKKYLDSFIRTNEIYGNFEDVPLGIDLVDISLDKNEIQESPPPEFNDSQKDAFVRIEAQSAKIENDKLVLNYVLSEPFGERIDIFIYVYGYRYDKEFSKMPKINIKVDLNDYVVYDQKTPISKENFEVKKTPTEITVKIPLKTIGNPDKILFSARTSTGLLSLDLMPWRIGILDKG
ncbi:MAG: PIG-L family deacetylase [Candidatus Methanofastidiosa archaeon]|nr:PIG-L family deacetylase [Candidatus Methanofastidiosa archaeon]